MLGFSGRQTWVYILPVGSRLIYYQLEHFSKLAKARAACRKTRHMLYPGKRVLGTGLGPVLLWHLSTATKEGTSKDGC